MATNRRGLLCAALLAGLLGGAAGDEAKAPDFYDAKRAVALVRVKDVSATVLRTGQGFFLRSGNLVTARHLLAGARSVVLVTAGGREFPALGVVAEDPATDLALLYAEVPEEERHFLVPAARGPRPGETGWMLARGADGKCEPLEVKTARPVLFPGIPGLFSAAPAGRAADGGAPLLGRGLTVLGVVDAWAGEAGAVPGFVLPADAVRRLNPTGLRTWVKREEAPSPHGSAYAAAAAAFVEGRWEDAAKGFAALPQAIARAAAAESRRRGGALEAALAAADDAVKGDGTLAEAHRVRGAVLLDLERLPDADAAFRRAVELDPKSLDAAFGLGTSLARAGKLKESIPVFETAAALSETDARPLVSLARARLASREFGAGYETAERAAARDPDSADAVEVLGMVKAMAGEVEEAEKQAARLDDLDRAAAGRLRTLIERVRKMMEKPPKGEGKEK